MVGHTQAIWLLYQPYSLGVSRGRRMYGRALGHGRRQ